MQNRYEYNNSASYENFLNRAFRYDKRISIGNNQELLNLIETEKGNIFSFLPTKKKQLEKIKQRLIKATNIFLKQKLDKIEKEDLKYLLAIIEKADSAQDIFKIIEMGLIYTKKLKN